MLTDRDERALIAAAQNRIAEPLRVGAALAAVGRLLRRERGQGRGPERESVAWHPTAARTSSTSTSTSGSSSSSSSSSSSNNNNSNSNSTGTGPRRKRSAPLPR